MSKTRHITLGIHVGHDAACAVAVDGKIVAAVQQERLTRVKHDGQNSLSNRLPISAVLAAADVAIEEVDWIVSSFQSAAPGGIGLDRKLVDEDFSAFDVNSPRHRVISHHLAHAYSAVAGSGFSDCAVLVCDLAGSATVSGEDFAERFSSWQSNLTSMAASQTVLTECLSIYKWAKGELTLRAREYVVPHSEPDCFIFSPASLYENVSRMIFGSDDAYGQLMALAGYADMSPDAVDAVKPSDVFSITSLGFVWRNDWQFRCNVSIKDFQAAANLAGAIQKCTEESVLNYSRKAQSLTNSDSIALAGGLFLNINSNSRISQARIFEAVHVPSAPHDAGVALGCAMYGQHLCGKEISPSGYRNDRIGPRYDDDVVNLALKFSQFFIEVSEINISCTARDLFDGEIVARWRGRSEFGPRALGARSILGSPLLLTIKDRLNKIKSRQSWRPVAPIVVQDRLSSYFEGPVDSPFMTYLHMVRPEHRQALQALAHADCSTRVQSLHSDIDPQLFELLLEFEKYSSYPVLVNTSLNGPQQPIVESPQEAIDFFLMHPGINQLLLGTRCVRRLDPWQSTKIRHHSFEVSKDVFSATFQRMGQYEFRLYQGDRSVPICFELMSLIDKWSGKICLGDAVAELGGEKSAASLELYDLLVQRRWLRSPSVD